MKLTQFFVRRRVTTLCLSLSITAIGLFAMNYTSIDLFPPIQLPTLTVVIGAPGLSSSEIEKKITTPLEELFNTLPKLRNIRTEGRSNQAILLLKFRWGTSMDFAALSVREALKTVSLPDEAEIPMIFRWNPALDPILRANISSQTDLSALTELVENKIRPQCERVAGVATIDLSGTLYSEIRIKIDPHRLASHGIHLFHLVKTLQEENIQTQVGIFQEGRYELALHLDSEFHGLEEIKNLPLIITPRTSGGESKKTIHLRDIADISYAYEDPKSIARVDNRQAITLGIKKMHNAHALDVIEGIKKELSNLEKELPVTVTYSKDDSVYIKMSRRTLFSNLWQGFLFTFICVFLFLRSLAATFVISIAIPISTIGTFALMKFFNVSQNVFSLAGFTLAAGMVVDCGVVILENIYRQMTEEGKTPWRAAVEGTQEVGLGVLTSTLSTMAIFIPIVLCVKGVVGILFNDIAFTFVITMALSLLIGFSLIPCAAAYLLGRENRKKSLSQNDIFGSAPKSAQNFFLQTVSYFLDHRRQALGFIGLIYAISFLSVLLLPGTDLIPLGEFKEFVVRIKGEKGTPLPYMDEKIKPIEATLLERKEIETVDTTVRGEETNIFIRLKKGESSLSRADQYLEEIRNRLRPFPEMDIEVLDQPKFDSTEGQGSPIVVVIKERDEALRKSLAIQISNSFKQQIPDILYLSTTHEKNRPEIKIALDHRKLADHALTAEGVADLIYAQMEGVQATSISSLSPTVSDRALPIRIIHGGKKRLRELEELPLLVRDEVSQSPKSLPLSLFASITETKGDELHERTDHVASETIFAHLKTDRRSLKDILSDTKRIIGAPLLHSKEVTLESSLKVFQDTFSDLYIALIIAIILVYMILAAQFESFIQPLVLILTLPLASLGILIGVKLWGFYLDVIVMLGIILLVGIAVETGILLIEYINILREQGMERKEAILTAVRRRMRPICITALTDISGTIPMALSSGAGAEMYQGFAVVTIFGMTTATIFTLLVLPLTYALAEDAYDFFGFGWLKAKTMLFPERGDQP